VPDLEPLVEVDDVHVSYGAVPALRGVSLRVDAGEAVAILGRNGVGKSTTLAAIAGLVRPSAGSVRMNGFDVAGIKPEHRVQRGVVLVPEGRGIFPELDVVENLSMGCYRRRLRRSALAEAHERAFAMFPELGARRTQQAGSLSGGEQQMLVTARGLLTEPRVLMVDEPSLGLAPIAVDRLYELFGTLRAEGIAVVVVEQYVDLALRFTDRAYLLDRGTVVMEGPSATLASSHELVGAYLATIPDTEGDPL
jgi:branched-chain amino acid transport system ATP-binding protein